MFYTKYMIINTGAEQGEMFVSRWSSDFFSFRALDIFSVGVGFASLLTAGVLSITVEASQLLITLVILFGVIAIIFGIRRFYFYGGFPLRKKSIQHVINFKLDRSQTPPVVVGKATRVTHFNFRSHDAGSISTFQLVTDPCALDASDVLKKMGYTALLRSHKEDFIKNVQVNHAIKAESEFSQFRKMNLAINIDQGVIKKYRDFELTEEFTLPNDFSQHKETYEISILEPVDRRKIKIEFDGISIENVHCSINHGSRRGSLKRLELKSEATNKALQFVEYEFNRLDIGSIIRFEFQRKNIV
ncbi:MAG: hypothetical protein R3C60_09110 [Parvularculaceae bacterium]